MLTKITIRNFKLFEEVEVPLGSGFVLVGPNNCGKTSVLQALTLWHTGLREWAEKHTQKVSPESGVLFISSKELEKWEKKYPDKRISPQLPVPPIFPPGSEPEEALINRLDLTSLPVPEADMLWLGRNVIKGSNENIRIELIVEGETSQGRKWECGLEFGYVNQESLFCRPLRLKTGSHPDWPIPRASLDTEIVFLPSMSGLTTEEPLIHEGRIRVLIGQGQPAGVLRNLCYRVCEKGKEDWNSLVQQIRDVFGIQLNKPEFSPSRGSLSMSYLDADKKTTLDITSCGRGMQQTLLLLAYIYDNPKGKVFLLDEPDAHLEIFRQRQIYDRINEVAKQRESQIIAASHSEELLNQSARRKAAVAFLIGGRPHRIGLDKSAEVLKALRSIGFEDYYGAEQKGWILYLEGETDLKILQAFAEKLRHPAKQALESPLVKYMGTNNPAETRGHFSALKEAKPDLRGFLLMDRTNKRLKSRENWTERMWKKREIENYLCNRTAILSYVAEDLNREDLFGPPEISNRQSKMEKEIERLEEASKANREPSPFSADFLDEVKTSDEFLVRLFMNFAESMGWPNSMALQKTDFDQLVKYIPLKEIDEEVIEVLDTIAKIAQVNSPSQK